MTTSDLTEHNNPPAGIEVDDTAESMLLTIGDWLGVKDQLKAAKAKEDELRSKIINFYFPNPGAGKAKIDMPDGWELATDHKLKREIDEAAVASVMEKMPEGSEETLITYSPKLKLKEYNKLHEKQQAIMDDCIIEKIAKGTLTLTKKKQKK